MANRSCPRCKAPTGDRAVCHACGQVLESPRAAPARALEIDLDNVEVKPQTEALEFQAYFGGRIYEENEIEAQVDGADAGAGATRAEIDLEKLDAESYPEIPLPVLCRHCRKAMPDGSPQCPHCHAVVG